MLCTIVCNSEMTQTLKNVGLHPVSSGAYAQRRANLANTNGILEHCLTDGRILARSEVRKEGLRRMIQI